VRTILFAYERDAEDITVQSGRPYSILTQLRSLASVINVSPLNGRILELMRPVERALSAFNGTYRADRQWLYLRWLSGQVERAAAARRCDLIFSPGSQAVTLLREGTPVVFCADAPFGAMVDFYSYCSNITPLYRKQAFEQEANAHARCAAAIYPSRWAADAAIKLHGASPEKTHVIPFGANVEAPPVSVIDSVLRARRSSPLNVLFSGRDWARKRGNLVVDACRLAREAGRQVILHVVGEGTDVVPADSFIVVHGVLDKRRALHRAMLRHLLSICHVFFTPSRAEAYGMSFCEASAWAMPSLTTAVGGIPSIIENGSTGWTLPPEADAIAYAEKLLEMTSSADQYRAMAWRARRDYDARLNWPAFIDRLWPILQDVSA
jgi:glycosyltransferase involved in cell wall biosynthesis